MQKNEKKTCIWEIIEYIVYQWRQGKYCENAIMEGEKAEKFEQGITNTLTNR